MTRKQPVLLAFVLLAACGELSRTPGAGDAGPDDAGSGSSRTLCAECAESVTAKCADGQCTTRCNPETPFTCGAEYRCFEFACQPDVIASCEERGCNAQQLCVGSYCVADTGRTCGERRPDDCLSTELCEPASGRCVVAPPCDKDLTCRPGESGAVCNTRRADGALHVTLAGEHRCLLGYCRNDDHCPASRTCRDIGVEIEALGVCR